jgi:hypothetical protein
MKQFPGFFTQVCRKVFHGQFQQGFQVSPGRIVLFFRRVGACPPIERGGFLPIILGQLVGSARKFNGAII